MLNYQSLKAEGAICHKLFAALLFLSIFMLISSSSHALTIKLEGYAYDIDPVFSSLISSGDQMEATFSYDHTDVSRAFAFATDRWWYYLPSLSYEISIGNVSISGTGGRAEVTNNYTDSFGRLWDRFILEQGGAGTVFSSQLESNFDINRLSANMSLYDFIEATALYSTALPSTLDLSQFDSSYVGFHIDQVGGEFEWEGVYARATHAEIVSTPVPEPSTYVLLGVGLGGLVLYRRKAKN